MRVTVERREQIIGALSTRRNYFADYIVQFSEEERAVIVARGLADIYFPIRTPNPPRDPRLQRGLLIAGPCGLFVATFSFGFGFIGSLFHIPGAGGLLLVSFVGFALAFLWIFERLTAKGLEQHVTIGSIIQNGKFTIWAHDPADLKMIEVEAKVQLYGVKQRIIDSIEIPQRETFEI